MSEEDERDLEWYRRRYYRDRATFGILIAVAGLVTLMWASSTNDFAMSILWILAGSYLAYAEWRRI